MSAGDRIVDAARGGDVDAIAAALDAAGVRLLAMTMVDNAGVTRVKVVPAARLASVARAGVGMSNVWATSAADDHFASVPPYDSPTGDMRLVPDVRSVRPLPAAPGWAWAAVDQLDQELQVVAACQRSLLARVVGEAAASGLAFVVTFEVEMTLLDAGGAPAHDGPGYSPRALAPLEAFALEVADALTGAGIVVEQLHPEYSPGQFEVSVSPKPPVEAADDLVLLRTIARQVARRHGLDVSFAPVVIPGAVGNGCHLHLSGWRDGANLMQGGDGPAGLTGEGGAMVAGIRRRLPELMAILAPGVAAYDRLQPHHWAGAYACWGVENREAALRFIPGSVSSRSQSANLEVKCVDGGANPYLAAALLLAAALDGVADGLATPEPVQVDPGNLDDDERRRLGVERLPTSLAEAADRLEAAEFARRVLGDDLHRAIVAVRRLEWDSYGDASPERLTEVYRWRY